MGDPCSRVNSDGRKKKLNLTWDYLWLADDAQQLLNDKTGSGSRDRHGKSDFQENFQIISAPQKPNILFFGGAVATMRTLLREYSTSYSQQYLAFRRCLAIHSWRIEPTSAPIFRR